MRCKALEGLRHRFGISLARPGAGFFYFNPQTRIAIADP
jgi:chromosome condensin MukBEF MukE localization factor